MVLVLEKTAEGNILVMFLLILSGLLCVMIGQSMSNGPKRASHELDHVVDVFELFGNVVGKLDFELIFDQDSQFDVIEVIDSYRMNWLVPSSHHCVFRFIFSTF